MRPNTTKMHQMLPKKRQSQKQTKYQSGTSANWTACYEALLAIEAHVMMANNRPLNWLSFQMPGEQAAILQAASILAPEHRRLAKIRSAAIANFKLEQIQEWERVDFGQHPGYGGWLLKGLPALKQREALRIQLRFHKKVLRQKARKSLYFAFSHAGKQFPADELKANLAKLFPLLLLLQKLMTTVRQPIRLGFSMLTLLPCCIKTPTTVLRSLFFTSARLNFSFLCVPRCRILLMHIEQRCLVARLTHYNWCYWIFKISVSK